MQVLRSIGKGLLDFALPPRCPACGELTDSTTSFCFACWSSLQFLEGGGCALCNAPLARDDMTCGICLLRPPAHDGVRSSIAYGETARLVVTRCKYGRRIGLARAMALGMIRHAGDFPDACLVPVPLHRWRLWSRGFNQSLLIARAIASHTNQPVVADMLLRTKATPPLQGLNPDERRRAVNRAFAFNEKRADQLRGGTVLLIDDVYTTGATANGCAALLKKNGAERVMVLCWARALKDTSDDSYLIPGR